LDELRALIQSLAEDFDATDIAAAALAMYQAASEAPADLGPEPESLRPTRPERSAARSGEGENRWPARPASKERPVGLRARPGRPAGPPSARGGAIVDGDPTVLAFSVGRDHGVRPADLVGAITGEAGVTSRQLGAIRIGADASTVEVMGPAASKVAKIMKGKFIRGEKVDVRIVT
ncbi:MAG: DbpA RNA binding domain-containing protein, partial [Acidobacteriota bacterium]|nr:DbpA RNA binding domain-containing protein [Acidobacteriota bacterium]